MFQSRMLVYLDEVARAGSMRKAATRLNVSATAINRQILMIEEAIGAPVFHRLPRGLRLTAVGEVMVDHARRALKDFKRMEARIEDLKGLRGGEVTIATMNGLAGGILPRIVAAFSARHRRVKVNIRVMFLREIVKAVTEGEADIGLAYNLPRDPRLERLDAFPAELGAVVAPNHPLAAREKLRLSDCASHPLIVASSEMVMHQTVMDAFLRADITVEPAFQSNSIDFMKCLAAAGEGVAFLGRFDVAEEVKAGALVYRAVGRALADNTLAIVHRAKSPLDTAGALLAEALRAYLHAVAP
jgi:DNA-binding transcriptional LysR family regulator